MKVIGMVGGIGPESTIDYYKRLLAGYDKLCPDQGLPAIIINSIDVRKALALVGANQLGELEEYLVFEIGRLARAGAELGLLSANTPHIIFDELAQRSPIPLVSIVEATCAEAKRRNMKKVGLLGTGFTMKGQFYPRTFAREGISLVVPTAEEQEYVHNKYIHELIPGTFLDTTREGLLKIARRLKDQERIEGLILGGTELPLILADESQVGIPFLDTTEIHVNAILQKALE
jgi:aspartate racemase